jgi:hypothetical protein
VTSCTETKGCIDEKSFRTAAVVYLELCLLVYVSVILFRNVHVY